MRYLGQRKTKSGVGRIPFQMQTRSHQHCATCHPDLKSGRAGSDRELRQIIEEWEDEEHWTQVDALLDDLGPFADTSSEEWRDWEEYQESQDFGHDLVDDWEYDQTYPVD